MHLEEYLLEEVAIYLAIIMADKNLLWQFKYHLQDAKCRLKYTTAEDQPYDENRLYDIDKQHYSISRYQISLAEWLPEGWVRMTRPNETTVLHNGRYFIASNVLLRRFIPMIMDMAELVASTNNIATSET